MVGNTHVPPSIELRTTAERETDEAVDELTSSLTESLTMMRLLRDEWASANPELPSLGVGPPTMHPSDASYLCEAGLS
eukprot:CAMPEP_0114150838 /NCGR_PEP_ID=MMETSP0043_2-20121206/22935_1 /TAXON_ID=464988 /ORGANISM="Hemiselmis andersenii, Strain CCMP644" /LENGTH=77 /DNA_ID=CAMNT_0001245633 /DNA_START=122 /DNA_END=352 /DNA_ORIENTATION=+